MFPPRFSPKQIVILRNKTRTLTLVVCILLRCNDSLSRCHLPPALHSLLALELRRMKLKSSMPLPAQSRHRDAQTESRRKTKRYRYPRTPSQHPSDFWSHRVQIERHIQTLAGMKLTDGECKAALLREGSVATQGCQQRRINIPAIIITCKRRAKVRSDRDEGRSNSQEESLARSSQRRSDER